MNGTAYELWQEWQRADDFSSALTVVAGRNPAYSDGRFQADSRELAETLLALGLLVLDEGPAGEPAPATGGLPAVGGVTDSAPLRLRVSSAVLAFLITLILLRLPFRVTVWVLTWLRTRWCGQVATAEQALAAIRAVDTVARYHPGRFACLELSLGAVIAMALRRRQLFLVIGVADDPFRFHAWVETHNGPLSFPPNTDLADFRPITVL
jgi:hypothetical protein